MYLFIYIIVSLFFTYNFYINKKYPTLILTLELIILLLILIISKISFIVDNFTGFFISIILLIISAIDATILLTYVVVNSSISKEINLNKKVF